MSITLAFILLTSLILWFVIGSKGLWSIKAAIIVLTLYLCLSVNLSLDNLMGWPSRQDLPEKFQVHWILIEEPDKKSHGEGNIYLWTANLSSNADDEGSFFMSFYNNNLHKPRAYRVDYSKELHKQAQGALEMIRGGQTVIGTNGNGKQGKQGGKGEGKGEGGEGGGSLSRNGGISFQKLPKSKLPSKGD